MRTAAAVALAVVPWASAQSVVRLDLNKSFPGLRIGKPTLGSRDTFSQLTINNITGGGYYVEVKVGSPGQTMSMVLDTGSSDAWVVSHEAELCSSARLQQDSGDSCGGTFNPDDSSTFKLVEEGGFSIQYLDESTAQGDYISDDFSIAGTTIKSLQMGYVTDTARGTGILGVGFSSAESTTNIYPNIVDQFLKQGLISSKSYSLWLNDRRSPTGTILFGGIDTDRFIGPLNRLSILKTSKGDYTAFAVAMNALSVTGSDGKTKPVGINDATAIPAILDSGTTLSYLPGDLADPIFDDLGAITETKATGGLTLIDCGLLKSQPDMTISFGFGNASATATIVVPVYEMVLDLLGDFKGQLSSSVPFDDACVFGIQSSGGFDSSGASSFALLGDTFLRSAYVVYDIDHKQIGIAQANLNSTSGTITDSKNVVEIKADEAGLPDVTGVAAQQTTYVPEPTGSTGGGGGGGGGGTGTGSKPTGTNAAGRGPSGGPGSDVLAVMAVAGVFAAFGGALFVL